MMPITTPASTQTTAVPAAPKKAPKSNILNAPESKPTSARRLFSAATNTASTITTSSFSGLTISTVDTDYTYLESIYPASSFNSPTATLVTGSLVCPGAPKINRPHNPR